MKKKEVNSFSLDKLEKTNIFLVPEGYFFLLENRIREKRSEFKLIEKNHPFRIPEDYFENLQSKISYRFLKESEHSMSSGLKENVFKIPQDYFSSSQNKIQRSVIPQTISNQVHQVPSNYFDNLELKIKAKIQGERKTIKVTYINPQIINYAIAASVTLVLFASGFLYFSINNDSKNLSNNNNQMQAESLIALLSKNEIKHYLENQETLETHDLIEFTSTGKQNKINGEFESILVKGPIGEKDKKSFELEIDEIDISDLQPEI